MIDLPAIALRQLRSLTAEHVRRGCREDVTCARLAEAEHWTRLAEARRRHFGISAFAVSAFEIGMQQPHHLT